MKVWIIAVFALFFVAGCMGSRRPYSEPDFIETQWKDPETRVIDYEKVFSQGHTVGYIKSVYHKKSGMVDYYIQNENLEQIGYVHGDGSCYRYSKRFGQLRLEGHYELQASVRILLGIEGDYYIIPAGADFTWDELEQMQPGRSIKKVDG